MDVGKVLKTIDGIILEPAFVGTCKEFVNANCEKFSDDLENRLEYTPVHEEYMETVEAHIEEGLVRELGPDFDMAAFMDALPAYVAANKGDDGMGETIDFLLGFGEFDHFKDMMLVAKRDKASGASAAPAPGESKLSFSPETEKIMAEAQEFCGQLLATGDGDNWTSVMDKPWIKIERWTKPGTNDFMRASVTLDMDVMSAVEMVTTFTKERNNWDDFMTDCMIVEEIDGDADKIVKINFKIPLVPTKTKHSRMLKTADFPEKGAHSYMYLDWDPESKCLAPARESLGTGFVKPHPSDPKKCIYISTHQIANTWFPSFLTHWMMGTFVPRMMTKMAVKYKTYKGLA